MAMDRQLCHLPVPLVPGNIEKMVGIPFDGTRVTRRGIVMTVDGCVGRLRSAADSGDKLMVPRGSQSRAYANR